MEFLINYNNKTGHFLPFREFLVELQTTKTSQTFRTRTRWTRVEFRNCSSDPLPCRDDGSTNRTVCCFNLPPGNYTSAVNPIDSRCNMQSWADDAKSIQNLPATASYRTGICRRHTLHSPTEILAVPRGKTFQSVTARRRLLEK